MWNIHRRLDKYNKKRKIITIFIFNYFPFLLVAGVTLDALDAGDSFWNDILNLNYYSPIKYITIIVLSQSTEKTKFRELLASVFV